MPILASACAGAIAAVVMAATSHKRPYQVATAP
jgi:hypothetical protein